MATRPIQGLPKPAPGASNETVTLAGCWAHLRRRFYELHINGSSRLATQTVTAMAAALGRLEGDIRGLAPGRKRAWPPVSSGLPPLWRSCSISGKWSCRVSRRSRSWPRPSSLCHVQAQSSRMLPHRRPRRNRFQYRRACDPASNNHAQERAVRGQRRRRPDMGNYRHPPADRENQRRRSASLARGDAPAHCRRLAHLPDRKTHAVELQDLNGLSFALTLYAGSHAPRCVTKTRSQEPSYADRAARYTLGPQDRLLPLRKA